MNTRSITHASFKRYLQARASELEAKKVQHWMSQPENKGQLFSWMWTHWDGLSVLPVAPDQEERATTERLLQALHSRLGFSGTDNEEVR